MTSCVGAVSTTPTAVRTLMSPDVAVSSPPCAPGSTRAGSAVTGTVALPPAGTSTLDCPSWTGAVVDSASVTGAAVVLTYVTSRVTGSVSSPKSTVLDAYTPCATARSTATRPPPCSYTDRAGSPTAVLTSASLSCCPVQSGWRCARIAAAPATCGAAMEVPDAAV